MENYEVGDIVEISGPITIKEKPKDGKPSLLITITSKGEKFYSRIAKGSGNYNLISSVMKNGDIVTAKGELKMVKGKDDSDYTFFLLDSISKDEDAGKTQIIRLDSKDSFIEVMSDAFEIDKVRINFIKYDVNKAAGSRQTANIPIYLSLAEAERLAYMITSSGENSFSYMIKNNVKDRSGNLFTSMGGTTAKALSKKNMARSDGRSISRILKIEPSTAQFLMLSAQSGPGDQNAKGLIVPDYKNVEQRVGIPLSKESAIELARIMSMHIQAYINSSYMKGR